MASSSAVFAAGFLGWMLVRTLQNSPWTQRWSLAAIVMAGLLLMVCARLVLRSRFFGIQRESDPSRGPVSGAAG